MLKKFGDLNPISIINPVDVDTKSTKKALKATIKNIKNEQDEKEIVPAPKLETETN